MIKSNSSEISFTEESNQRNAFMSILSHELKTPTTSLKAYAHLLEKKLQQEGTKETIKYISKMNKQIDKLTDLIQELIEISKMDNGKLQYKFEKMNFDNCVEEIMNDFQNVSTHIITKKGTTGKSINGDCERIGQVMLNLLSNAAKFSPNSDRIIIETFSDDKDITFSVEDFGIGLTKRDIPFVFDRFFRTTDSQHATFPGLGLGLFISSEIIKKHNGKIWVESKKGKGSKFAFSIPIDNYLL